MPANPEEYLKDRLIQAQALLAQLPVDSIRRPAALPPGSRLDHPPNEQFVGRDDALLAIAAALARGETAVITPAATSASIGGLGKTQLACEAGHRYGRYFLGGVFWLPCQSPDALPAKVLACGFDLPEDYLVQPPELQAQLAHQVWDDGIPRLLIFDSCEDEALLARWRPTTGVCCVLVTSRQSTWSLPHMITIALPALARPASIALLASLANERRPALAQDAPGLNAVAEALGDLPLALQLAGSFLASYPEISPTAYVALIAQQRRDLQAPAGDMTSAQQTAQHDLEMGAAFQLSYEQLLSDDPTGALACELLARAACFAPGEMLPNNLLLATLPPLAGDDLDGQMAREDALGRLQALGLLEEAGDGLLRIHRLVSWLAQRQQGADAAQASVESALDTLANTFNRAGDPRPLLAIQTHLRSVTDRALERQDERAARLCNGLGYHLKLLGAYGQAGRYYERALAIREQVLGAEHLHTATSLNNLGSLLKASGDLAGARPHLERALAIRAQLFGAEHPDTTAARDNLSALLAQLGEEPAGPSVAS